MNAIHFKQPVDLSQNEAYHSYCAQEQFSPKEWFKTFSQTEEKNLTSERSRVIKQIQGKKKEIFSTLKPLIHKLKTNKTEALAKKQLKNLKKTIKEAKKSKTSLSRTLKVIAKSCEKIQIENGQLQRQFAQLKQMSRSKEIPTPFIDFLHQTVALACQEITSRGSEK